MPSSVQSEAVACTHVRTQKKNSCIYVETHAVDMMWMMEIMRAAILMCFIYWLHVDLLPCEGAYNLMWFLPYV